jgi:hypothetical protein
MSGADFTTNEPAVVSPAIDRLHIKLFPEKARKAGRYNGRERRKNCGATTPSAGSVSWIVRPFMIMDCAIGRPGWFADRQQSWRLPADIDRSFFITI